MNKGCGDCKFLMQSETCACCGHKDAKKTEHGRGRYTYPPANFQCDIDKFEERELPFSEEMKKTAANHGWTKVEIRTSYFGGTITYYKR